MADTTGRHCVAIATVSQGDRPIKGQKKGHYPILLRLTASLRFTVGVIKVARLFFKKIRKTSTTSRIYTIQLLS